MILEYHRPTTIESALHLLSRKDPITVPMGGGTCLNQPSKDQFAVVDLQELGLNEISKLGQKIHIGATVTLQQLVSERGIYAALKKAIRHRSTYNMRHIATIAGALVSADGRSPLAVIMLALGAELIMVPGNEKLMLGDYSPLRDEILPGRLITNIQVRDDLQLSYKYVARTPADLPIVCVGAAMWKSGRTRIAVGGHGTSPLLAFDGPNPLGADKAAGIAYKEAGDQWAGAEYRSEMAAILTIRCLEQLNVSE